MNKLKIAIVGLNFGEAILIEIRDKSGKDYFEVAGVCDLDIEKAKEISKTYNVKYYDNLDAILEDKEVHAIGLYTPPNGRAALIEKIISRGKHVMTTKPFEINADKALSVLKKARDMGIIIHMNSPSPVFSPELRLLKQWHETYKLGRPIACRADVWACYREKYTGTWYDDMEKCPVAPIFRIGIYMINDIVRLFGQAEEVQVMHSRIFTERPTPDNAQMGIKFKNGAICNIFASFCVDDGQFYKNSLLINYENGSAYKNVGPIMNMDLHTESNMMLVTMDEKNSQLVVEDNIKGNSGLYQWDVFYKAINGDPPEDEVTPEEITEAIRIINAMAKAEKSGASEKV
jgi:predicted dehydrogenase